MIVLATPGIGESQDSYQVHVSGLACPFCVYGLERSIGRIAGVESVAVDLKTDGYGFGRIAGVESVAVDLKTGVVRISVSDGVTLDEAIVQEAVQDAGFTVEGFEPVTSMALRNADGG
jgi:mercuric ion binding protein